MKCEFTLWNNFDDLKKDAFYFLVNQQLEMDN